MLEETIAGPARFSEPWSSLPKRGTVSASKGADGGLRLRAFPGRPSLGKYGMCI